MAPMRATDAAPAVSSDAVYEYEPGEGEILAALLPKNLTVLLRRRDLGDH
jgi:F-type H+-transporting ATPase subunit gamma